MDPLENPQNSPQSPPSSQPIPIQQPTNQVPSAQTTNNPPQQFAYIPPSTQAKEKKPVLFFLLAGIIAIVLLFSTATVMFAYNMIPIGDQKLRNTVADVIMQIPFMPKSPRYVLKISSEAHQKITRVNVDASIATSNSNLGNIIGPQNLDVQITGPVDYTDPENPILALNIKLAKDFNIDLSTIDQKTYFKINSIPSFLGIFFAALGVPEQTQNDFTNRWFYYDIAQLDTQARKMLKQQKKSYIEQLNEKLLAALDDKDFLKSLSMKNETIDNHPYYHITFKPNNKTLEMLFGLFAMNDLQNSRNESLPRLSEMIKDYSHESWISKKDFLVHKMTASFVYKSTVPLFGPLFIPNIGSPLQQDIPVSIAVNLSDFDKPVNITTPQDAVKFEDFLKSTLITSASQSGGLIAKQFADANNTKRRSDINMILNAVYGYIADYKGAVPSTINTATKSISTQGANLCSLLVPTYIAALPVDPSLNNGDPITECSSPYETGYTILRSKDNSITVSAPNAQNNVAISITR